MRIAGESYQQARSAMWAHASKLAAQHFGRVGPAEDAISSMNRLLLAMRGGLTASTLAKSNERFLSSPYIPAYPSTAFDRFVQMELARLEGSSLGLQLVIFAVTSRCSLSCAHCLAWNELGASEALSASDLDRIVSGVQDMGTAVVWLSGGEPILRFREVIQLVRNRNNASDIWILTSGVGLNPQRACELAEAGLTGVLVSLDHWDAEQHDRFRGRGGAFDAALKAAVATRDAGLAVGVTLVPTKAFTKEENLQRYFGMVREARLDFLHILEPKQVGRWDKLDVKLSAAQTGLLDRFYEERALTSTAEDPIVVHPGYLTRKMGCQGAGRRYAYIDQNGTLHPCPFCRGVPACTNDARGNVAAATAYLQAQGCPWEARPPA